MHGNFPVPSKMWVVNFCFMCWGWFGWLCEITVILILPSLSRLLTITPRCLLTPGCICWTLVIYFMFASVKVCMPSSIWSKFLGLTHRICPCSLVSMGAANISVPTQRTISRLYQWCTADWWNAESATVGGGEVMCSTRLNGLRKRERERERFGCCVEVEREVSSKNTSFNVQLLYISSSYVGPVWREDGGVSRLDTPYHSSWFLVVFGMGFCSRSHIL